MILTVHSLLLIAALICFLLVTVSYPTGRLNLTGLGLALCVLSILVV